MIVKNILHSNNITIFKRSNFFDIKYVKMFDLPYKSITTNQEELFLFLDSLSPNDTKNGYIILYGHRPLRLHPSKKSKYNLNVHKVSLWDEESIKIDNKKHNIKTLKQQITLYTRPLKIEKLKLKIAQKI